MLTIWLLLLTSVPPFEMPPPPLSGAPLAVLKAMTLPFSVIELPGPPPIPLPLAIPPPPGLAL